MELVDINGIGPVTAELLTDAGLTTVASVANADAAMLANIRGIGPVRGESIKAEAVRLLDTTEPEPTDDPVSRPSKRERRGNDLRKRAKKLRKQAKQQAAKAKSANSKKKRKQFKNKATQLDAAAQKARRKAKKLLAK